MHTAARALLDQDEELPPFCFSLRTNRLCMRKQLSDELLTIFASVQSLSFFALLTNCCRIQYLHICSVPLVNDCVISDRVASAALYFSARLFICTELEFKINPLHPASTRKRLIRVIGRLSLVCKVKTMTAARSFFLV